MAERSVSAMFEWRIEDRRPDPFWNGVTMCFGVAGGVSRHGSEALGKMWVVFVEPKEWGLVGSCGPVTSFGVIWVFGCFRCALTNKRE